MKKVSVRIRSIIRYITTVITWSIFVILVCAAAFLFYYFISLRVYEAKGSSARPAVSIYTIVSPSMVPTIDVYDIVLNKRVTSPDDIEIGDIITFVSTSSISKGLTITHRVINKFQSNGSYRFETKGDNNVQKDSMPADFDNVIGVAFLRLPQLGRIQFFLASGLGWILVVVLPSLFVIIKDVIKLVKVANLKRQARMTNISMVKEEEKRVGVLLEDKESPILINKS